MLHWVVQDGFFHDPVMSELVTVLERYGLTYTVVTVVPFEGRIIPDLDIDGPVICIGSYSMRYTCAKKGWYPGVFDLDLEPSLMYSISHPWNLWLLNRDGVICSFGEVSQIVNANPDNKFFMRPLADSKSFTGAIFSKDEYDSWVNKVRALGSEVSGSEVSTLTTGTEVLVSTIKDIWSEWRLFIIYGQIVTASKYVVGGRVEYSSIVDEDVLQFGRDRIVEYHIANAYVLDICRTEQGLRIVEINAINCAGVYAGDISAIIKAFELHFG